MKKNNNWKTIKSEIVHKNPWYKIQKDDVMLANGNMGEYFIVKVNADSAAFVVPIKDGKIIFVRQYRYIFNEWFIELPGGGIGKGETCQEAAIKELYEEAGFVAKHMKEVGKFVSVSGILDEFVHVFIAKGLQFVGQKLEATEEGAEVLEIPIKRAYKMIEDGEIIDAQTITSLMIAKKHMSMSI